jgi:hypothetical protein
MIDETSALTSGMNITSTRFERVRKTALVALRRQGHVADDPLPVGFDWIRSIRRSFCSIPIPISNYRHHVECVERTPVQLT